MKLQAGTSSIDIPDDVATRHSKVLAAKVELESEEPVQLAVSGKCLLWLHTFLESTNTFRAKPLWKEDKATFYELLNLSNFLDMPQLLESCIQCVSDCCIETPIEQWAMVL